MKGRSCQNSMMLINSLMAHASDPRWDEFIAELERLNVRKAVIVRLVLFYVSLRGGPNCASQRLMSSHTIEDLTSCILDFQANMVRVTFRKKTTLVEPDFEPLHSSALQFIWERSRLQEDREDAMTSIKWRKLGFDTEDIGHEFREVGVLGLDCLVRISPIHPWRLE